MFRVDAKAEAAGLDIIKHKERAYDYGKIKTIEEFYMLKYTLTITQRRR